MERKPTAFMSTVKVGPKGQIVIPKEIRDMFGIGPGDSLLIMAAPERGIAMHRPEVMEKIADAIYDGKGKEVYPHEAQEHLSDFAKAIRETKEKGRRED